MSDQATADCETYSEAGHRFDDVANKWKPLPGARSKGLSVVGAAVYAEHPSTDVLTLSYCLPGRVLRRWKPGDPLPYDLFEYLAAGGAVESHNAIFEWLIWTYVLVPKYGFPPLNPYQQRCSMAKARVQGLPGSLKNLSDVLDLPVPKDPEGDRLLKKFSIPRDPTKKDVRTRILPTDDPADFERLCGYCDTDVVAEEGASERMEPMTQDELEMWWIDQEINRRGMAVDRPAIRDCIVILEAVFETYVAECERLTGGLRPSQGAALIGWFTAHGLRLPNMRADTVRTALGPTFTYELAEDDDETGEFGDNGPRIVDAVGMPPLVRRVLEIRALTASASVKKLYALENCASRDDRLRNMITHHGARTGRPTGNLVQPLNLPRGGPEVKWCDGCKRPFKLAHTACPWCSAPAAHLAKRKWSAAAVDHALEIIASRSLELVEYFFGDALLTISGCVRGLFVAGPGMELICSDYSAIEAVVLAALAGEEWRLEVFRSSVDIYLAGASKITGTSVEAYLAYAAEKGDHHPDRQKIGKVSELACGFGGWVGSYKAFGSTEPDDVIKAQILAWRAASPNIVEFWGGQYRGLPWDRNRRPELYGVEGMCIAAIQNPGFAYEFRGLQFYMRGTSLKIRLPSTRELTYQFARVVPSQRREGELSLVYKTWNSNPKYGPMGWVDMETYGARVAENITQAVEQDLQRYGVKRLRALGYPMVLLVYDENCAEVPIGTGDLAVFEAEMSATPDYARTWPVRAVGGWRGRRYRKG